MLSWADVVKGNKVPKALNPSRLAATTRMIPAYTLLDDPMKPAWTTNPIFGDTPPTLPEPPPPKTQEELEIDMYFVGDNHTKKSPHQFRFLFNNINRLSLTSVSLLNFTAITKELQADWTGRVEIHMASDKSHVWDCLLSTLQSNQGFSHINAVFSSSNLDYDDDRKFGGTLQFTTHNLVSRSNNFKAFQ
jgi:hypothetical protein